MLACVGLGRGHSFPRRGTGRLPEEVLPGWDVRMSRELVQEGKQEGKGKYV